MAFNYASFVATSKKLITRFGTTCQISRAGVLTEVNVLLDVDVTETSLNQAMMIMADRTCILAPTPIDPITTEDHLIINNSSYRIMQAKPVGPSGVIVLWTLIARL